MKAGFFQKLSLTSKSSFLWTDGQFLLNRQAGKFQVKLFFVFDYFVEVYFDEYQKQIEKINVDIEYQKLNPFIDDLDISDFY